MSELIKGMKGGKKQLYLKQNRTVIRSYYAKYGAEDTCVKYNMTIQTLEKLLKSSDPIPRKDDRAVMIAQIANERSLSVLRELEDLKKQYAGFVDSLSTQITEKFFKPLLQSKLELPAGLEVKEDTRLKLSDMGHDFEAK